MYALDLSRAPAAGARLPDLLADIRQSLAVIVGTPPGAKIHDPEFGCSLWDAVDRPMGAVPAVVAAVVHAVRRDEPRVSVERVEPDFARAAEGRVDLVLHYRVLATGESQTANVVVER